MRQILSISLPTISTNQIKKLARKRGFNSVSVYINQLLQAGTELISETELLKTAELARKEYRAGKSIQAKSLADLI